MRIAFTVRRREDHVQASPQFEKYVFVWRAQTATSPQLPLVGSNYPLQLARIDPRLPSAEKLKAGPRKAETEGVSRSLTANYLATSLTN